MGWKKSARSKRTVVSLAVAVAVAAAAVMVIMAKKPTQPEQMAAAAMQPDTTAIAAPVQTVAPAAKKAPVPAKNPASAKTAASVPSANALPETAAMRNAPVMAVKAPVAVAAMTKPAMEAPVKSAMPPATAMTTIAGCLERDGDSFRLKDTSGNDAPKSRSWKSGFLKKGTPRIELLDSANRLKFRDHVGQRVSVTGMLNDREMQARSLQSVSTSCD